MPPGGSSSLGENSCEGLTKSPFGSTFISGLFLAYHHRDGPPDIVKSFYKNREVTLRDWAASQPCRCGQVGVGVALRNTREARNWIRER
jgi:hypothetical protein